MPVRPSKNPKVQARTPHYGKPQAPTGTARELAATHAFRGYCEAAGKTPTVRQARKYLARAAS